MAAVGEECGRTSFVGWYVHHHAREAAEEEPGERREENRLQSGGCFSLCYPWQHGGRTEGQLSALGR